MLKKIATACGRSDEAPNIELAQELCAAENELGIQEIAAGLRHKDAKIAGDCIKVLYEIGERKPRLIAKYCLDFIELLSSKNNRLVWGAMTALAHIAHLEGERIYRHVEVILSACKHGSVITTDNGVTVLAKLCNGNAVYSEHIFPELLEHLRTCRPKEVAQHAERIAVCVDGVKAAAYLEVLDKRKEHLTNAQTARINRLEKRLLNK